MIALAAAAVADAASSPARFAVTLQGTVVDSVGYDQTRTEPVDCRVQRKGNGGRTLVFRSTAPTTITASRSGKRVVYRPSRVAAVRVTGTTRKSAFEETRACRAAPIRRIERVCRAEPLARRRVRLAFTRPAASRIAFRAPTQAEQVGACGLDRLIPAGWIDHAAGKVDERLLLDAGVRRVVARGSATAATLIPDPLGGKITRRTTVRWTLTFRRLG